MAQSKRNIFNVTIKQGLGMANKGNVFWTKRDAMQSLSLMHKLNKQANK